MEIDPLHPEFGAEVRRLDLERTSPEDVARLRAALDRHQLLVLRADAAIPPERQVEIAGWFGTPMDNGGGKLWSVLRNEEATGSVALPFHQDFTYTDCPIKIITLNAIELPPGGTTTSFVSNIANWAALPERLRDTLEPMTVRHRFVSKNMPDWPEFVADHPVCTRHPRTGEPMLFVTEHHADRILELDPEASRAMLDDLLARIYADEHVYTHRWRPHDLLIWDNLSTQHARREVADIAGGRRAVRRVIINDVPFPELVERARRRQAERQHA